MHGIIFRIRKPQKVLHVSIRQIYQDRHQTVGLINITISQGHLLFSEVMDGEGEIEDPPPPTTYPTQDTHPKHVQLVCEQNSYHPLGRAETM